MLEEMLLQPPKTMFFVLKTYRVCKINFPQLTATI